MELVEPPDRRFEGQVAARCLELQHQVGGSGVEDAVAALDEGEADAGGEMALAGAGRAEADDVVAVVDPVASLGEDADERLGQSGQAVEVEVVERLAGGSLASARWRSKRRRARSANGATCPSWWACAVP